MNSLLLVFFLVSTLEFAPYEIFNLSSFRALRLKTGKHKEIKSIRAGRMKTKLRIAFENLVKLKSHQQEMAVLSYTVEMSNRVQNGFVCEKLHFFFLG